MRPFRSTANPALAIIPKRPFVTQIDAVLVRLEAF